MSTVLIFQDLQISVTKLKSLKVPIQHKETMLLSGLMTREQHKSNLSIAQVQCLGKSIDLLKRESCRITRELKFAKPNEENQNKQE